MEVTGAHLFSTRWPTCLGFYSWRCSYGGAFTRPERLVLARQALSDNRVRFVRMGDLESGKYRCKFDIISSLTQVDVNWTMAAFKTWNRNGVFMCHYNVSV